MFDVVLRRGVDPALNRIAVIISRAGIGANALTIFGAVLGVAVGVALLSHNMGLALLLILTNRVLDGLDGAVARIRGTTLWGGYLDSIADYVFYVAVPVGFGLANPNNLIPALLLLGSFTITAVSFFSFAAIAAQNGIIDEAHGPKSFVYSTGLMEGGETIAFFVLMCLFPNHFGALAMIFAGLCLLTTVQRLAMAARRFRG